MSRWNIRSIVFYSHDERRHDIGLEPRAVNIITGESHTGKSAVAEVIDYAMGAGECHLPGLAREAVAWVGMVWEREEDRFALARRVPRPSEAAPDEMFWRKGSTSGAELLPPSKDGFTALESRQAVLRQAEQAFGIGEVLGETLNPDRPGSRISARHVVPYLLQDDDVIISKSILLRGMQDQRRLHIMDSLPYFLRVTSEESAALESEARRLRSELRAETRRAAEAREVVYAEQDRALTLLTEAAQLGLVAQSNDDMTLDEAVARLEATRAWAPGKRASGETDELARLRDLEETLRVRASKLRAEIRAAELLLTASVDFDGAVRSQARKLSYVEVFRNQSEKSTCPICNSDVVTLLPSMAELHRAHGVLSAELAAITRDRPKLDGYVRKQRDELAQTNDRLAGVRRALAELVAGNDATKSAVDLDYRRSHVVGRVSFYLDSRRQLAQTSPSRLDDLRKRLGDIEKSINEEAKRDRLEVAQQTVAGFATKILQELPFEDDYRNAAVYFLARKLECGIVTTNRQMPIRDVGSDENYLSLHVALLLALHRFFKARRSPVPGVLLLDQISRPYYPPEENQGEVLLDNTEAKAIRAYFDFLFKEVEAQGDLQVIVLEHAYFASDARFVAATKRRWRRAGEKLIPSDWPRVANI